MTETIYRCNNPQCRKVKSESNHWIGMRFPQPNFQEFVQMQEPRITYVLKLPSMLIVAFEDSWPDDEHYCSPACATKRFTEFVDELRSASIRLAEAGAGDLQTAKREE